MKRRQFFIVAVDSSYLLPSPVITNYIQSAIVRYNRVSKRDPNSPDYFDKVTPPTFVVRELDAEGLDATTLTRESVQKIKAIRQNIDLAIEILDRS